MKKKPLNPEMESIETNRKAPGNNNNNNNNEGGTGEAGGEEDPILTAQRLLRKRLGDAVAVLQRGVKERDVTLLARSLRKCTETRRMFAPPQTRLFLQSVLAPTSPRSRASAAATSFSFPSSSSSSSSGGAKTSTTPSSVDQLLPQLSLDVLIDEISSIPGLSKDPRAKEAILKPLLAATHAAVTTGNSLNDGGAMAIESTNGEETLLGAGQPGKLVTHVLPEVELFLHILTHRVALESLGRRNAGILVDSARTMIARAKQHDRRTMDQLLAKAWGVFSLTMERSTGGAAGDTILNELLAAHRTACLKMDEMGQATMINLILRILLSRRDVAQASKFAGKAKFPDRASNNQHVRYLYYMGRVEAVQLQYGKALALLQSAIRKAPAATGLGFRLSLYRLTTVVQLLTGETPDRAWFSEARIGKKLAAYFELVKAVRSGSVASFEACVKKNQEAYARDGTLSLVHRLHSSVIKTGLKAMNASYSRISFKDAAVKLGLGGSEAEQAAEFVCMKAVRDGVLDAALDAEAKCLISTPPKDVYSTTSDPQRAFQRRTNFLLEARDEAVMALRYPPPAKKGKKEDDEGDGGSVDEEKLEELEDAMEED